MKFLKLCRFKNFQFFFLSKQGPIQLILTDICDRKKGEQRRRKERSKEVLKKDELRDNDLSLW